MFRNGFIVLAALTAAFGIGAPAASQQVFVFEDVNVVPMDAERVLRGQTVIVRDGRIESIGDAMSTTVPSGARVINGQGRYLVPGLAEMHAHVPPSSDRRYLEEVLFLYVANGVTTARGMLGEPAHLELRERLARNEVLGPRLYTSGPSLNDRSVSSPDEAARIVREQAAAGYDFVKLHPGLTREEFDAAVEAAREAGIELAGHVSEDVGVARALEARQATIDHLDGYAQYLVPEDELRGVQPGFFGLNLGHSIDEALIARAVEATVAARVYNVPTLTLLEHWGAPTPSVDELMGRPEMAYVSPAQRQQWRQAKTNLVSQPGYDATAAQRLVEIRRKLVKALHDAEPSLILLGSDAPQVFNVPGFSLHRELASMVAAGLSPYEAIRTGTVHPAAFFGAEDEFGRIAPGLSADFMLVDGNPLEDVGALWQPAGVMVRGVWLDRETLDARLAEIAERYR
ncbi:MAG: amidohydrolase family protein [Gammaproteobacteria bacterium]|nr:amidohydrolase [Gammaproteobacteria bacterium]